MKKMSILAYDRSHNDGISPVVVNGKSASSTLRAPIVSELHLPTYGPTSPVAGEDTNFTVVGAFANELRSPIFELSTATEGQVDVEIDPLGLTTFSLIRPEAR